MVGYLTLILSCQLLGEVIVGALGLPVPGPVLGMAFLFAFLLIRGHVPDALGATADGLLRNMSLLFVPAGTGVIMHVTLLSEALVPALSRRRHKHLRCHCRDGSDDACPEQRGPQ